MTRNGCGCPPRKRIPRGVLRGWMVRPHSINLLFYFSGSPHSPFLHLFLSRFMKGRGGKRGEGAILAGPLCSSRGKRPLVRNSPSSLLSSSLASSYSLSNPSSLPPSRPRPRSWLVGWFHYPLRAMHCRSFTAGLPTQFLHVSLSLVCLSVTPLSPLFISW